MFVCWSTARALHSTLILAVARGPSGMLTASTPASAHWRQLSRKLLRAAPVRGGRISTLVTICPAQSFAANLPLSRVARALAASPGAPELASSAAREATVTCCFTPLRFFMARAAMRMCCGVVPQQPPTPRAPIST